MNDQGALQNVAERYRHEGYDVALRPTGSDLPGFLAHFAPDMIARKNGDNVVVQVRLKEELGGDQALSHLAGVVNAQPGWRFDLVVLNPRRWPDEVPSEAAELGDSGITALVEEAAKLIELQLPRAAFVTAWAAVEAAMREAARRQGISLERNDPRFVLTTLYSGGLLSREQYEQLSELLGLRNAAVHGLQTNPLSPEQVDALIGIVKHLLNAEPTAADS
jgi:hypothetical protein